MDANICPKSWHCAAVLLPRTAATAACGDGGFANRRLVAAVALTPTCQCSARCCAKVLMYFQPDEVRQVLQQLAQVLPAGSVVVLDTMARCAVGQAQWHASVGQTQAQFHWGITQMQELTACHPRLQLRQSHSAANHGWMGVAMETMWNPWGHNAPPLRCG